VGLFDFFDRKRGSAHVARERLSLVLAHERGERMGNDVIARLREELIAVICRHTAIDKDALNVSVEQRDSVDVLKVDLVLPEGRLRQARPSAQGSA
jgi:cell division topological specificity factor